MGCEGEGEGVGGREERGKWRRRRWWRRSLALAAVAAMGQCDVRVLVVQLMFFCFGSLTDPVPISSIGMIILCVFIN